MSDAQQGKSSRSAETFPDLSKSQPPTSCSKLRVFFFLDVPGFAKEYHFDWKVARLHPLVGPTSGKSSCEDEDKRGALVE
jgi:hypothetical protein